MKRVVFLGAAAATLVQFTKYDLTALQTLGCEIHMVCNMQNGNLSEAALHEYNQTFPQLHWHDLPFADSAAALRRNHQAYQKLLPLLKELKPDLLHCHGTIAGQYGRRAAQELGIPVFYTAHDFRVFHGCLLAERVYFSAVERKYRKATEVFFAVCPEDAAYAKKHLNQAEVVSLPDVGLDYGTYMPEADALAAFICQARADGLDILCQCEYGQSRSAACAAAILEYFNGTVISVFADYRYYPNQVVYHKIMDALTRYGPETQSST